MKLYEYRHTEDFGHEWFFHFLSSRRLAVIQINANWDEHPGKVGVGIGLLGPTALFNFDFIFYKLRFYFDFLVYHPTNLNMVLPIIPQKYHKDPWIG